MKDCCVVPVVRLPVPGKETAGVADLLRRSRSVDSGGTQTMPLLDGAHKALDYVSDKAPFIRCRHMPPSRVSTG